MENLDNSAHIRLIPAPASRSLLMFPFISRVIPQDALNLVGLTKLLIALMLSFRLQESILQLGLIQISTSPLRYPFSLINKLADIYWLPAAAFLFIVTHGIITSKHKPKVWVEPPSVLFRFAAIIFGIMLVINLMEAPADLSSQYSSILLTEGVPIVFMLLCLRDHQGMRLLLGAMAFWSVTTTVIYFLFRVSPLSVSKLSTMEGRLALGDNEITTGIQFFLSALSSIMAALVLKERGKKLYMGILLTSATYLILCGLLSGSRGPIVAFFFCICIFCIVKYKFNKKLIIPLLLLCCLLLFVYVFASKIGVFSERVSIRNLASETRMFNLTSALSSMPTLFGRGVGGFRQYIANDIYIHNCLVESYYEHGILGLILYVTTVSGALIVLLKRHRFFSDIPSMLPLLFFIFYIIESQFSGTLYSYMPLWALFIYAAIPLTIEKRLVNRDVSQGS